MNSAAGHTPEEINEPDPVDRRRQMKLVTFAGAKKSDRTFKRSGSRIRINLADNLLDSASDARRKKIRAREISSPDIPATVSLGKAPVFGVALLAGVLIGYLLGRRRN